MQDLSFRKALKLALAVSLGWQLGYLVIGLTMQLVSAAVFMLMYSRGGY